MAALAATAPVGAAIGWAGERARGWLGLGSVRRGSSTACWPPPATITTSSSRRSGLGPASGSGCATGACSRPSATRLAAAARSSVAARLQLPGVGSSRRGHPHLCPFHLLLGPIHSWSFLPQENASLDQQGLGSGSNRSFHRWRGLRTREDASFQAWRVIARPAHAFTGPTASLLIRSMIDAFGNGITFSMRGGTSPTGKRLQGSFCTPACGRKP